MLRKRDGDNYNESPSMQAKRLGGGIAKVEPGVVPVGSSRLNPAKKRHSERPWPKPPQKLVAHEGQKAESKTPIPVRTPAAMGVAASGKRSAEAIAVAAAYGGAVGEAGSAEVGAANHPHVEYSTQEFVLVRAPRTQGTQHNLLKFREGSEVDLETLKQPVTLRKVEDELDEQLEMAFPVSGTGSEFGKAAKEALRRRKYRRRERELDVHFHMEDRGGHHLLGEQQREQRGKLFLVRRRSNGFEILPVTDSWEFRRFKESRGGAADAEAADKELKEARGSNAVAKILKKSFVQKSEKETFAELVSEHGVKLEEAELKLEAAAKKAKPTKAVKVATTHKVDLFSVDVDDEDSNEEIDFAPDEDSKLGGIAPSVFNKFTGEEMRLEESSDSDTDEEVDVGGNTVVRRQRLDEDLDDEAYLHVDDDGDADEADDKDDDWTAEEQGPAAAVAAGKEAAGKAAAAAVPPDKTSHPRDEAEGGGARQAPAAKRRKLVATMSAPPEQGAQRRRYGLPPDVKKDIRGDLTKYLRRVSLKGMTLATLLKKLKKKKYMTDKRNVEHVKEYMLTLLKEIAQLKRIEGEERFVLNE